MAMTVLKKDKDEHGAIGCLVIGTENSRILILDPTGVHLLPGVHAALCLQPVFTQ